MRRRVSAVALTVLVAAGCGGDSESGAVAVTDVWARTTPAGATTGAIYLTLESDADDALVAVAVDPSVAATAELHMSMEDAEGTSMMHALDQVPLLAGVEVAFEPNGNHVMLVDLAAPLAAGDTFAATLQFTTAPDADVNVTVSDDAP